MDSDESFHFQESVVLPMPRTVFLKDSYMYVDKHM